MNTNGYLLQYFYYVVIGSFDVLLTVSYDARAKTTAKTIDINLGAVQRERKIKLLHVLILVAMYYLIQTHIIIVETQLAQIIVVIDEFTVVINAMDGNLDATVELETQDVGVVYMELGNNGGLEILRCLICLCLFP